MKKYFYPLIENPYRKKDINRAVKTLRSCKITSGKETIEFQKNSQKRLKAITLY